MYKMATQLDECLLGDFIKPLMIPIKEFMDQDIISIMYKRTFKDEEVIAMGDIAESIMTKITNDKLKVKICRVKNELFKCKLTDRLPPLPAFKINDDIFNFNGDIEIVVVKLMADKPMDSINIDKLFENSHDNHLTLMAPLTTDETLVGTIDDAVTSPINVVQKSVFLFEKRLVIKNVMKDYNRSQLFMRYGYDKQ